MKAKLTGHLHETIHRDGVRLWVKMKGQVEGEGPVGREIEGDLTVRVSERVAKKIQLGAPVIVTIAIGNVE